MLFGKDLSDSVFKNNENTSEHANPIKPADPAPSNLINRLLFLDDFEVMDSLLSRVFLQKHTKEALNEVTSIVLTTAAHVCLYHKCVNFTQS